MIVISFVLVTFAQQHHQHHHQLWCKGMKTMLLNVNYLLKVNYYEIISQKSNCKQN